MEELKARSFRITDTTSEKIKELANEIDGNQQQVMAKLIEAYEFQRGKTILSSKKDDIEKFEQYTSLLTTLFMTSLEENQNITEAVRTEFESQLRSKDTTIAELQEERTQLKQKDAETTASLEALQGESEATTNQLKGELRTSQEKIWNYEKTIDDKEQLNQALATSMKADQEKLKEAEEKIKNYTKLSNQHQEEIRKKEELKNQLATQELELKNQLQQKEFTHEKALLKLEKEHQEEIQKIKMEQQQEVDRYQQKYFELMEKLQGLQETAPAPEPTQEKQEKKPTGGTRKKTTTAKASAGEKNQE